MRLFDELQHAVHIRHDVARHGNIAIGMRRIQVIDGPPRTARERAPQAELIPMRIGRAAQNFATRHVHVKQNAVVIGGSPFSSSSKDTR